MAGTLEAAWRRALRLWAPSEHLSSAMITFRHFFSPFFSHILGAQQWFTCLCGDVRHVRGLTGYVTQEEREAL